MAKIKRESYTNNFKLKVVLCALETGNRAAVCVFDIWETLVRESNCGLNAK